MPFTTGMIVGHYAMSYEFNPESPVFEFPNPYKVENIALILSGCFVLGAGLFSLFSIRARLGQGEGGKIMAVAIISVALLLFGISVLARAFTQLRFFFGRNRPESLAPLLNQDQDGNSHEAAHYKETLRQNAITFREPQGAINGLLYSRLPNLIFAPDVLQRTAQTLFFNVLALGATLISFMVCWLMFGNDHASAWIGVAYTLFAAPYILKPLTRQAGPGTGPLSNAARIGTGAIIMLIVLAVLGPVVLRMAAPHLPDISQISLNGALVTALLCALAGGIVCALALRSQLHGAPQAIGSARVTQTVTMNAHPNKLLEELDRILMSRWYSQIPNRRYLRRSPLVEGSQGQFTAELFEETQPRPQARHAAAGIGDAWTSARFRWLALLTLLAMIYLCAGTLAAVAAVQHIMHGTAISTQLAFAISQFAVSVFCYRAAHILWGRFDFVSEMIWVDINGSYEAAQVNIGNQISGNVQTAKSVINVESMTMRVWVSEIDSVIFGKDAPRQLIGMRGLQHKADELASLLKQFGEARSMVVAPTSHEDMERSGKIGVLNELAGGQNTNPGLSAALRRSQAFGQTAASTTLPGQDGLAWPGHDTSATAAVASAYCTGCGQRVDADARFCKHCGKSVKDD